MNTQSKTRAVLGDNKTSWMVFLLIIPVPGSRAIQRTSLFKPLRLLRQHGFGILPTTQ